MYPEIMWKLCKFVNIMQGIRPSGNDNILKFGHISVNFQFWKLYTLIAAWVRF